MSLNDFVKELQNRYKGYVGINHVEMDVEEAQRNEGDGDFIYEDSFVVIGNISTACGFTIRTENVKQ